MYYKIENKECEVYKQLHELRKKEIQISKDNETAIEEKTGLTWESFLGTNSQQNFRRVPQYSGFEFNEAEKVDLKIWKEHSEHKGYFIPNRRTKIGREMSEFLRNGLKGSRYDKPFEILGIEHARSFVFPFVEIGNDDIIVLYLHEEYQLDNEDIIEITKKEFDFILSD